MSAKVIPITGIHTTAKSLLAEVMSDESVDSVIIYVFDKDGNCKPAHFAATLEQYAIASIYASKVVMTAMEP